MIHNGNGHRKRPTQFAVDVAALRHGNGYIEVVGIETAAHTWQRVVEAMSEPEFELDLESFAVILHAFDEARAAGVVFDGGFVALMHVLKAQAFDTAEWIEDDTASDEDKDNADDDWSPPASSYVSDAAKEAHRRAVARARARR